MIWLMLLLFKFEHLMFCKKKSSVKFGVYFMLESRTFHLVLERKGRKLVSLGDYLKTFYRISLGNYWSLDLPRIG